MYTACASATDAGLVGRDGRSDRLPVLAGTCIRTYLLFHDMSGRRIPGYHQPSVLHRQKKEERKPPFYLPQADDWLRYVLLAITAVMAVFGFSGLCLLLDPYSNFGRITASLFRPVVMWGNNILADPADESGQLFVVPCDNQHRDGLRSDRGYCRVACFHRHDCFPRTAVL